MMLTKKIKYYLLLNWPFLWSSGIFPILNFLLIAAFLLLSIPLLPIISLHNVLDYEIMKATELLFGIIFCFVLWFTIRFDACGLYTIRPLSAILTKYFTIMIAGICFCFITRLSTAEVYRKYQHLDQSSGLNILKMDTIKYNRLSGIATDVYDIEKFQDLVGRLYYVQTGKPSPFHPIFYYGERQPPFINISDRAAFEFRGYQSLLNYVEVMHRIYSLYGKNEDSQYTDLKPLLIKYIKKSDLNDTTRAKDLYFKYLFYVQKSTIVNRSLLRQLEISYKDKFSNFMFYLNGIALLLGAFTIFQLLAWANPRNAVIYMITIMGTSAISIYFSIITPFFWGQDLLLGLKFVLTFYSIYSILLLIFKKDMHLRAGLFGSFIFLAAIFNAISLIPVFIPVNLSLSRYNPLVACLLPIHLLIVIPVFTYLSYRIFLLPVNNYIVE